MLISRLSRNISKMNFPTFENILVTFENKTAIVQLNRPKAMNALNHATYKELELALFKIDAHNEINSIILTGSDKVFAAGADIKELCDKNYQEAFASDMLSWWENLYKIRKPIIAAVSGYALGGGFEVALLCDFIIANSKAKFGLPEITIGTIPGMGATQRLIREVGKAKAMHMILTGEFISADEAKESGLVLKVVDDPLTEAKRICEKINTYSSLTTSIAKEAVKQAYELPLSLGVKSEKQLFWSTYGTEDQKEGMKAFVEKRKPEFKGK